MPRRQLAAALASVIAGIAIGWLAGVGRGEAEGSTDGSNRGLALAAGGDRRHAAKGGGEAGGRRDFAAYLKRVERSTTHPEAEQAVARMSREELQTLLAGMPEPDWRSPTTREGWLMSKVHAAAAAELMRRDGTAAIDWAQAGGHRGAWGGLLKALAEVDPAAAKERQAAYGDAQVRHVLFLDMHAVAGAAKRSAQDVIACLKLWENLSFRDVTEYAPGFDYAAVVAHVGTLRDHGAFGDMAKYVVGAWAAADPDAAAAAMIQGMRDESRDWSQTFGPALVARAGMAGEDAAGQWVAGILKQVPDSKRYFALQTLIDRDLSAARANGLIAHLDDRDRIDLAFVSLDLNWNSDNRQALLLFHAMPSREFQVQALQQIADQMIRQRAPDPSQQRRKQLESLMGMLELSEAEMQKVFESAGGE